MKANPVEYLSNWAREAVRAETALAAAGYGGREAALARLALKGGQSVQTLRRSLAALRFVRELEKDQPQLASELTGSPVAAVEHLARWYRRDREQAVAAAKQLAVGLFSVRSLEAAEKASRTSASVFPGQLTGRDLELVFRNRLTGALRRELNERYSAGKLTGDAGLDVHEDSGGGLPLDFTIRTRRGGSITGVLIVGPYQNEVHYSKRATDWCLRAVGISKIINSRVVLFVPSPDSEPHFRRFLDRWSIRPKDVSLGAVRLTAPDQELVRALWCAS